MYRVSFRSETVDFSLFRWAEIGKMQELGSIQNVGGGFYANNATPRKAVRDKGGGDGRQGWPNATGEIGEPARKTFAETIADELKNLSRKSLLDDIIEANNEVERDHKPAASSSRHSAADYWKMDSNFGVE